MLLGLLRKNTALRTVLLAQVLAALDIAEEVVRCYARLPLAHVVWDWRGLALEAPHLVVLNAIARGKNYQVITRGKHRLGSRWERPFVKLGWVVGQVPTGKILRLVACIVELNPIRLVTVAVNNP